MPGVLHRVLEVWRIDVHLIGRNRPDLLLLELKCRHRPARKIVIQPAILHRRPVAKDRRVQHRIHAVAGHQLLNCLQRVEDPGIARSRDGKPLAIRDDHIAFGLHLGRKLRRSTLVCLVRRRIRVDRLRDLRPIPRDQDIDRRSAVYCNALCSQVRLKIVDRKQIVRRAGRRAIDLHPVRQ